MFSNKSIIITGASVGIGEATAKLFAENGAIVFNLDIKEPSYSHSSIHFLPCDVAKFDDVSAAFHKAAAIATTIDFVFANAGIHLFANIEDTSIEELDRVINVNLKGVFHTLKCALPVMKQQNKGSIVMMGSDQSFVGKSESAVYGATKDAIAQLTKSTAIDYAKYNIRVNCICAGTIDTPLVQQTVQRYSEKMNIAADDIYDALKTAQPISRIGEPKDIAHLVEFLCSDKSSFMTGSMVSIDGGFVAQ